MADGETYVLGARGRVLVDTGGVDGVILPLVRTPRFGLCFEQHETHDLAASHLSLDVGVHGPEATGLALRLASATCVDDGFLFLAHAQGWTVRSGSCVL